MAAVEEGEAYPALGMLLKLSRALGLRLGTFLDDHCRPDPAHRARRRAPAGGSPHLGSGARTDPLLPPGPGQVRPAHGAAFIEIGPEEPATLTSHEGEEFLIAVSGQLVIHYGRERNLLEPGDSIYYNSIVPHSVSAGDGAPATAYAVIYQPF